MNGYEITCLRASRLTLHLSNSPSQDGRSQRDSDYRRSTKYSYDPVKNVEQRRATHFYIMMLFEVSLGTRQNQSFQHDTKVSTEYFLLAYYKIQFGLRSRKTRNDEHCKVAGGGKSLSSPFCLVMAFFSPLIKN